MGSEQKPTKRLVASCVKGFFNLLGLLSPFTIHGNIIIQHLWRSKCDPNSWELWKHEHSYGCVAYLRAVIVGNAHYSLMMSRTKMAPVKRQAIPRLEMMGIIMGALTVLDTHSYQINRTVF
ncbi:uncharacterized protein LOC134290383 [Aedes albopictus]|uniref:Secreted protein n=1 Tax=Aedes albopictus TaxID=7160 RepID=A0ABM1YZ99_AEDAL